MQSTQTIQLKGKNRFFFGNFEKRNVSFSISVMIVEYGQFHKTVKELVTTLRILFQKQFAIKMETFERIYAQMGTLLLPTYIKLTVPLID